MPASGKSSIFLRGIVGVVFMRLYQVDTHNTWDAGAAGGMTVDYSVRVDSTAADWLGPFPGAFGLPSGGLISVRVAGVGWCARLYRSGVYNVGSVTADDLGLTFTVDQFVLLTFNAAAEHLSVSAFGAPVVNVDYHGPFAGDVKPFAINSISSAIKSNLAGPLTQAQNQLNTFALPDARATLTNQLQSVVDEGAAHFTSAAFRTDGVIVRGDISVRHRYAPQVSFDKTSAGDGFDAIESWIPGGRVDRFEWSWRWFTGPVPNAPGPPGTASEVDSFLLKRPHGGKTKFGLMVPQENPLPGLDGLGQVCLTISGVHIDHVTGALVRVTSEMDCAKWGTQYHLPYEVNGPYIRVCDPLKPREQVASEIGVMRVGVSERPERVWNTLIVYMHERWNDEAVSALKGGLARCRLQGYGLTVILLFAGERWPAQIGLSLHLCIPNCPTIRRTARLSLHMGSNRVTTSRRFLIVAGLGYRASASARTCGGVR